jgi:hypothetical protein
MWLRQWSEWPTQTSNNQTTTKIFCLKWNKFHINFWTCWYLSGARVGATEPGVKTAMQQLKHRLLLAK